MIRGGGLEKNDIIVNRLFFRNRDPLCISRNEDGIRSKYHQNSSFLISVVHIMWTRLGYVTQRHRIYDLETK